MSAVRVPLPCCKRRGSVISSCSLMSQARWPPRDLSGAMQSIQKGTEPCSDERRLGRSSLRGIPAAALSSLVSGAHHNPDHQPLSPPVPTSLGSQLPGQPPAPARPHHCVCKVPIHPRQPSRGGSPTPGSFPSCLLTSPTSSPPFSFMCRAGGLGSWGWGVAGPGWPFCEASR